MKQVYFLGTLESRHWLRFPRIHMEVVLKFWSSRQERWKVKLIVLYQLLLPCKFWWGQTINREQTYTVRASDMNSKQLNLNHTCHWHQRQSIFGQEVVFTIQSSFLPPSGLVIPKSGSVMSNGNWYGGPDYCLIYFWLSIWLSGVWLWEHRFFDISNLICLFDRLWNVY